MKKMKKTAAMLMAATVAVAMPMTAMAGTINVEVSSDDDTTHVAETYKAYKIFDYTASGDAYAYTINEESPWYNVVSNYPNLSDLFTLTESTVAGKVVVSAVNELSEDDEELKKFAIYLSKNIPSSFSGDYAPVDSKVDGDVVKFEGLDTGYYFVNTTAGTVCSLLTAEANVEVKDKNTLPSVGKEIAKIVKQADGTVVVVNSDSATASIGDTIEYKVTVTSPKESNNEIVVHDEMGSGLDLNFSSIKVIVNGEELEETTYWSKTQASTCESQNCNFEVTLKKEYIESLTASTDITIVYSATLNSDATVGDEATTNNGNKVSIEYSKTTIPDKGNPPVVKTYEFNLEKTDGRKVLNGAEFELYADSDLTKKIEVVSAGNDYKVAMAREEDYYATVTVGTAEIKGLGNGVYYLKEVKAPEGYNALTSAVAIKIEDGKIYMKNASDEFEEVNLVEVVNNHGTILPSTGGIGTTVFYAAGIVVMAGAVFFVIRSKKHE